MRKLLLMGCLGWVTFPAAATPPVILVLGDSLSAAYGLDLERGWVQLLQERLSRAGYPHRVVNASISGDTTLAARNRLPATLAAHPPAVCIVALGGNDGLRGLPLSEMEKNLAAIIEGCQAHGARVLLLGMRLPPNYGPVYTRMFSTVYSRLARRYETGYVPFLLEGVAQHRQWMQEDNIHPRAAAQPRILDNVWPALQKLLGPRHAPATSSPPSPQLSDPEQARPVP